MHPDLYRCEVCDSMQVTKGKRRYLWVAVLDKSGAECAECSPPRRISTTSLSDAAAMGVEAGLSRIN